MSSELAKIPTVGHELTSKIPGIEVPAWVPVDPRPFNEMAKFFGAAGTVMALLHTRGHTNVSSELLRATIRDGFWACGTDFCLQVERMIMDYYQNPRNRERSTEEIAAYLHKLALGQ